MVHIEFDIPDEQWERWRRAEMSYFEDDPPADNEVDMFVRNDILASADAWFEEQLGV